MGKNKLSLLLLASILLALLVLGPRASLFAELDEPPRGAELEGTQQSGEALQLDGTNIQGGGAAGRVGLDSMESDRETIMMDNLRRGVLMSVSWIFLVVSLTLVALTLGKTYIWLKAVQKARVPPTRYFNLQLEVRGRDGDLGLHNFDYYPVIVAAAGSADLLLPEVEDPRARFRIDYQQGQAHLHSDSMIIVNGVPRQKKPLKQDDRIIFGPYRLMFKDASIREQPAPIPGKPAFVWQFPIVALLLALSILFKQGGVVPEDKMLLAKAAELQSAAQPVPVATSTEQSSRQPENGAAEEVSHEGISLTERLGRIFSGRSAGEVRPAEAERVVPEQRIAVASAQEPAVPVELPVIRASESPKPAAPRVRSTGVSTERLPVPEPAGAEPAAPRVRSTLVSTERLMVPEPAAPQGGSAGISAELPVIRMYAASPQSPLSQTPEMPNPQPQEHRSTVPTEVVIAKAVESSVSSRIEIQRPPDVSEDTFATSRMAVSSQPLPARNPVPASEPPAESTAQVPVPRSVDTSAAREEIAPLSQRRASQQPPVLQASVLANLAPATRNNGINPLEGLSFAKARSEPEIGRVKVRVIPPGRPVEYFRADILFIHAHPDDESIDFGSLMARASRLDKRIATLLFTDGESGLDLYPQRKVGDIYPARDLTGGALSQVRVVEATRALSVLGSEMYVRWGLENRPYNTKRDEVPPDEVIRGWGGEERLVERLIEVLEGFSPTIVVSPDRHSKAYEHFEHEAVGQLVQTALQLLRQRGKTFVKGYLVSIDPYQVDRYSGVTEVDAQALDGESGLTYRSIQVLALKEHVTQRDASVIGVSRLSHLPQEFYKTIYWDLELSLEDYLK